MEQKIKIIKPAEVFGEQAELNGFQNFILKSAVWFFFGLLSLIIIVANDSKGIDFLTSILEICVLIWGIKKMKDCSTNINSAWIHKVVILFLQVFALMFATDYGGDLTYLIPSFILAIFIPIIYKSILCKGKIVDEYYIPEKTYRISRSGNTQWSKYSKMIIILGIIGTILSFWLISASGNWSKFGYIMFFVGIAYYGWTLKESISVHEDVDYVTNSLLEEILDMELDEVVRVSYQNFDSSNDSFKEGNTLFLMTNRQIYYAKYTNCDWYILRQYLKDITHLGIDANIRGLFTEDEGRNIIPKVAFRFVDNGIIFMDLDVYDKLTSTPQLVIRQIIQTLDDYLTQKPIAANRRRRVINNQQNVTTSNSSVVVDAKQPLPNRPSIEIGEDVVDNPVQKNSSNIKIINIEIGEVLFDQLKQAKPMENPKQTRALDF